MKNLGFHAFRLLSDEEYPPIHRILMDGEEVSGVKQAIVIYNPGELPSVWLKMNTLRVDIDAPEAKMTEHSEETDGKPDDCGNERTED